MKAKLEQLIAGYPVLAVGGALAIGAALGLFDPKGRVGRAIAATLGALATNALRETAMRAAAGYAKSWIDQRHREPSTYEPSFH